ncbi:MAG: hypothetical protein HKM95_02910 [Inquilinus sp.]|nr:hypothetical protein [Inquilinus sp.]
MTGFFQTLIHPDHEDEPERLLVISAANILEIGEFQLLQLAHFDWYGADMPEAMFDRMFSSYMVHGIIPPWARHYARQIIELDEAGQLDFRDPAYHRYDSEYVTSVPDGVRKFCYASLILVVMLGGGILISSLSTFEGTSILPPYFERGELEIR